MVCFPNNARGLLCSHGKTATEVESCGNPNLHCASTLLECFPFYFVLMVPFIVKIDVTNKYFSII